MAEKSITVCVDLVSPAETLILDGFTSTDTVSVVEERVLAKAMDLDLPPLLQDIRSMVTPEGHRLEDNQTLASLSNSASDLMPISMYYLIGMDLRKDKEAMEEFRWLNICEHVRFIVEAHEASWRPHQVIDNKGDPVSIEKRPKITQAPLPFAQLTDLGINGQYKLLGSDKKSIRVSEIRLDTSVRTTASVILLAPSDKILKDLVLLNTKSEYLVLRVSWDILSYFFLRTLRSSYPSIPIVAVTDLDPHHLDLLTFLDTPPENVLACYGWDLSRDFDEVYATDIEFVEIQWLGLRPTDCEGLFSDGTARPHPPLSGFHEVIRMLRVNPFLRMKEDWLAALNWLDEFGRSVSFHPLAPADPPGDCHVHLGDDFIAKKVSEKDWV